MVKVNQLACITAFLLCFSMCARADWCIVANDAPADKLQGFLDFACGIYDCGPINPGGSCYDPNTLQAHGSYALDLVFRNAGNCAAGLGFPALTDPSYGDCHYP